MVEIDDKFKEGMLNRDEKLEVFEKYEITDDYLIRKLKEELEAKETKFFQKDGSVVETENVIAWKIRQDARKDAHKLRGDYPAEKHEHIGDVIFHSNVPEPDMPDEERPLSAPETKEKREHPYEDLPSHEEETLIRQNEGLEEEETLYVTEPKK